jgi:hypothetical protein
MPVKKTPHRKFILLHDYFMCRLFNFLISKTKARFWKLCQFPSSCDGVTRPSVGWGVTVESESFNDVIIIIILHD